MFQLAARAVCAVIGGDVGDAAFFRRVKGAPSRGARPGVDKCYIMCTDYFFNLRNILPHHKGVLALQGQRDKYGA